MAFPFTATLGVRYSDDKKYGYSYLNYVLPVGCGGSCEIAQEPFNKSWGQWTGKGGLTYQVSDNVMTFLCFARLSRRR